ncbi:MAG: trypsin-like peptidase domain-containing protein [Flavobacteriales bacterium]|nr:trypsin-like peptidase domain-containing protein [Flavobacteriales bacterium]
MKIAYSALFGALLLLPIGLRAQVSFGGEPYGLKTEAHLPAAPTVVMPTVDAAALMVEDDQRALQGIKGPYRFGFNHVADLSTGNSGVWTSLPNGDAVWRLAIECPGAFSINFEFNDYIVPVGGQVFVYNEAGEVLGAFTAESNPGHTILGVTQLAGDRITVEYVEPAAVRGEGFLHIRQVTHAYRDIMHMNTEKGLNESGSCNNNVICPVGDPWRDQIRSVAMITVGGSGICTGQLINNCANNGTPYFLTANHCLGGNNSWIFRFNWNSPTCTPTQNAPTNQTVSGSTLKASSGGSDVALLQLNSTPPANYNVFYSGWDKSGTTPTNQTCIHHPSGDIKKISFDYNAASQGTMGVAACWHISAWDDGTTEPGSSGSGLWNQNGLLIGQLYGGEADCSNNVNDFFGRFNVSYPLLTTWLGTCGNTLQGYPLSTGIDDATEVAFTIAPNPTQGAFTVTLPAAMRNKGRVTVYDALGQQVLTTNVRNGVERINLDLSDRTEGIYLVDAVAEGFHAVQRLVLTH